MYKSCKEFCLKLSKDCRLESIEGSTRIKKRKIYKNNKERQQVVIEIRFVNNTQFIKSSNMYYVYFEAECKLIKVENSIDKSFEVFKREKIQCVYEYIIKKILQGEQKNVKKEFNFAN